MDLKKNFKNDIVLERGIMGRLVYAIYMQKYYKCNDMFPQEIVE